MKLLTRVKPARITTGVSVILFVGLAAQGTLGSAQEPEKTTQSDCVRMMQQNPEMMHGMMNSMMSDSAMGAGMMQMMMGNAGMRRMMMRGMMSEGKMCPMCAAAAAMGGPMGAIVGIIAILLLLSVLAVLLALTVFLIRRSRSETRAGA